MSGEAWLGMGLTIIGLGIPAAVALLRLLPRKNGSDIPKCPIREHEARMGKIETNVAVLQENSSYIRASLLRIEKRMENIHEPQRE